LCSKCTVKILLHQIVIFYMFFVTRL
jgi:hypothetical protein